MNQQIQQTIIFKRVVHLSHAIAPSIPQWRGDPPVEFETFVSRETNGYYLRRFCLGEHSATHMNAPISFHSDGIGIDRYSAESLVVPAVVINIQKGAEDPDYALTLSDILSWEQQHGQIPPGSIVLAFTGWQYKWSDIEAFFNLGVDKIPHFPGFGLEATQFLLFQRQIAGVGIDTHGVDPGQDDTFAINRLVLSQPRIVLENLTNLDQLPPTGTTLVIGILRLQSGSGCPVAVLALVP